MRDRLYLPIMRLFSCKHCFIDSRLRYSAKCPKQKQTLPEKIKQKVCGFECLLRVTAVSHILNC